MKTERLFNLVREKLNNIRIDPDAIKGTQLMLAAILAVHNLEDNKIENALNDFLVLYQEGKIDLNRLDVPV